MDPGAPARSVTPRSVGPTFSASTSAATAHSHGASGATGAAVTPPRPSPAPAATIRRALITGGCGFLGLRLAAKLAAEGMETVLLDLAPPKQPLPRGATFFAGSVADAAAVDAAFVHASAGAASGLDAVFHVASYGMSGRELRNRGLIWAVNVGGTRHVLDACVRHGVPRLVYVSTVNTIWVGRPILGDDESAPYPPETAYKDPYSATKAAAEKMVIAANGTPLQTPPLPLPSWAKDPGQGGAAATAAAISPTAGIGAIPAGLFVATFGDPQGLVDWIHVENLVQLLALAERGLRAPAIPRDESPGDEQQQAAEHEDDEANSRPQGAGASNAARVEVVAEREGPVAAGQVYYASDGSPINNFDHFKPIIVGLGYRYPSLNMPYAVMYGIAALIEYGWPLLRYIVNDPPLTRMEVGKCAVPHWFSIGKARRELGYAPAVYDRAEVVEHMRAEGWAAGGKAGPWEVRLLGMRLSSGVLLALVVLLLAAAAAAVLHGTQGSAAHSG
ncbi:hypothetical protein GPECTOR_2g1343 [Gonium pectorale]|uniref:3-beta hydroxysteroid dehydrogenase/isomerase domain-containing protein n=1 Tax=Gonium pectorale TaxID=33097 RepID=A0A150H1A7_GONPE|nr:hypothetical protein GPECTOR_2g1343 [Gonium pectorale]|eukprot:KXZ55793.1 hypothetical protein GPECTOR_2g1343 [Gonium pectorale]